MPSWRLRVPAGDPHGSGDVILRRADGLVRRFYHGTDAPRVEGAVLPDFSQ